MAKNRRRTRKKWAKRSRRQVIRIDVLPDDVLLEIFDFYVIDRSPYWEKTTIVETWQLLVHVCQRWRNLVFGSPRRLNLQLYCTPKRLAKDTLDIWPALPLIVWGSMTFSGTDNVIAALGQSDRVCQVILWDLVDWKLEKVLAAMQVPFPELTNLELFLAKDGETLPVIPDSFLDGSAPRLRIFYLTGILFPGFPKLLLSATLLVYLRFSDIPYSEHISPEAMIALLSALSSLDALELEFRSPQSRPDRETRPLPPSKHSVIPVLEYLRFQGIIEYLEDLVTFLNSITFM